MPTGRADCDEHERADASAGRAKRHPHADLPGALLDEIREHAEEAGQRQQQAPALQAPASARTQAAENTPPCAR